MALKPAIFLDKDGTVLKDVPYNVDPDRMVFERGVPDGLRRLAALGWPLYVVSNQPGVALRYFQESALRNVEHRLGAMFAETGASLAGMYCCPHHPAGSHGAYSYSCVCRKPAPGLLLRAASEHAIDLDKSWMMGDILNDVEAGSRAGCRTVFIDNGNETEWQQGPFRWPTITAPDFAAAARAVSKIEARRMRRP
jgi:D-glycero-D-manno-heptose 1,7-bisphosphate phosphatase